MKLSPNLSEILPTPFHWCKIPTGKTTINGEKKDVASFYISKYPITNAQFAKFIEAGGYKNDKWWTKQGWQQCKEDNWAEPLHWHNKKFNGVEHPVVGISWFETVAFCLWLHDVTSTNIMLPTETQWQYAAQGNDGRTYPWGNEWDCQHCNNSVKPCRTQGLTSVQQYEGKGNSPFGVVDMVGNVKEWCLTDYVQHTNDIHSNAIVRILRGSDCFFSDYQGQHRCDHYSRSTPDNRDYFIGFRIICF